MIVKSLFAGALALVLTASQQAATLSQFPPDFFPRTIWISNPYVEKISCNEGSGSGFKIQDGRWLSARHVTNMTGCKIDGLPIKVTYSDDGDLSIFEVPGDNRFGGLPIDCGGFRDGRWYYGVGHGRGDPWPQIVAVRYSALYTLLASNGWGILDVNRFVPGQSGGFVEDEWGRVVGIVNAFGLYMKVSMSRQLRDSPICAGKA